MRFIVSIFLVLHVITLNAQENHQPISGHVFELIGNDSIAPLVGVNVFYLGTTNGTTSNSAGYFELEHDPSNHMLVFSFVGYQSDTLHIQDDDELNIVLSEGKILEDVVVEFKKGSYSFSRMDPRHAHIIRQDELRKAACCNLAESFETDPSVDATFTDAVTGTKQIQMMGLSGKYVQMLSGNIPVLRGLSLLHGLKQIPGPFIHQIAVSKGAGSVLNGFESMVGQINMNLKQPEYAEKFHLNFYLNQGGRSEYNAFYTHKFNKWSTTFMAHYEDQSIKNDRNQDDFLDMPLHNDFIFHNQWNYRSSKIHMELGCNGAYSNANSGSIDVEPAYPVNMEIWSGNAFAKIGYLFPNDDFKSLALQLSTNLNDQQTTIGLTNYRGRQLSGYANLIFQQELGKNPEENYYKFGASFQVDSVSEILSLRYL
ncbi:MAG: TonB-dependent receptor, partial [Bacteroidota bacterium]|nr:TonB-dependent receptor [Bacteroidota bacterium]